MPSDLVTSLRSVAKTVLHGVGARSHELEGTHMNTPIAYTVQQAAVVCGLSRTTLYGLIKTGELTPVKIGVRTLIRHADLEALVNRKMAS